ncbi:hypothetical protein [Lactobacillus xylocopicola]|nr:hypothetical protein [Lactobacillus xylocopicola]
MVTLFDYSTSAAKKGQVKVTDFTNNVSAKVPTKSLNTKAVKIAQDLNKDVKKTVVNATDQVNAPENSNQVNSSENDNKLAPRISVSCSVFTCTKYKKYGGKNKPGCERFINRWICPAITAGVILYDKIPKSGKVASAFCNTVLSIGCYVPKGKTCIEGRTYRANVCPMQMQ